MAWAFVLEFLKIARALSLSFGGTEGGRWIAPQRKVARRDNMKDYFGSG